MNLEVGPKNSGQLGDGSSVVALEFGFGFFVLRV